MKNNIIPVLSNIVSLFPGNKDISLEICKILFKLNLDGISSFIVNYF